MNPINAHQYVEHAANRRSELLDAHRPGRRTSPPPRPASARGLLAVLGVSVAALTTSVVALAAERPAGPVETPAPAVQIPAVAVRHVDCAHPVSRSVQRCV